MRSDVSIATKKDTLQLCTQSFKSQKTSLSLNNLHINDWYQKEGPGIYLLYPPSGLV